MIKIKHNNSQLIESNIPIPEQISEELLNCIKVHILNYLLDNIEKSIQISQRNFDKSKEELKAKPELAKGFYDDAYMKKQEDMIIEKKRIYTVMHKHIPSDKYVVFSSTLRPFETMLSYARYIPASFKYEILPNMANDDLTLEVYFDNKKVNKTSYGDYGNISKTIRIFCRIWEDFLETMSTPKERWQEYGIYWSNVINDPTKKFNIDSKLDNLWSNYKSTLNHELIHFVQYVFIPKGLWHKGAFHKSVETEDDYRKYINSNVEFYPNLTSETIEFFHTFHNKFSNENFNKYIDYSTFFHELKQTNIDKWKKAVTQFYMLLQSKITESIINNVSHRLLLNEDNMIGKDHDLKQWNMVQLDLIKQLVLMRKLSINDIDTIYKFGQTFEKWVLTHNMQSPSAHEISTAMRL